ncbi:hypothetical protein EmuJ_000566400 [Echinococcus multilocularis]|uniref:Uncharacterized protein n=1 Tax=Echinococcus multilocularis TaxID=6211 RepID=A0A068Y0P3_ECHMU|nr:hypothetical protein EmuJ_000566400 [Echinococcus multilocularis]
MWLQQLALSPQHRWIAAATCEERCRIGFHPEDCATVSRAVFSRPLSMALGMVDHAVHSNKRLRTDIGGSRAEHFVSLDAAIRHFHDLFFKKAADSWLTERANFLKLHRCIFLSNWNKLIPRVTDSQSASCFLSHIQLSHIQVGVQAVCSHFVIRSLH